MSETTFRREPLTVSGEIPVFSQTDDYIENYDQIAKDHLATVKEEGLTNPWIDEDLWSECEQSTEALIRKYSAPGERILDVGVGLGRLLSRIPEWSRYGMDISLDYLEIARTKGLEVCMARVEDMPYRDDVFDVVVCTDVLEHVLDLAAACRNIVRVLRPGGVLIVRVPYREDMKQYVSPDLPYTYIHLRNFDEYSLQLLFERTLGLEWLEQNTVGIRSFKERIRWPANSHAWARTLDRIVRVSGLFGGRFRQAVAQRLYHPYVINCVVRKPRAAKESS